jgi:hypothetical protein
MCTQMDYIYELLTKNVGHKRECDNVSVFDTNYLRAKGEKKKTILSSETAILQYRACKGDVVPVLN